MSRIWIGRLLPCLLLGPLLAWAQQPSQPATAATTQVNIQGMLSEQVETQLDCAFAQLPQEPEFRTTPLRRAQQNLLESKVDGYFGLPFDPAIEQVAEPTTPLLIRKWNRYSYDEHLLNLDMQDPQLRIGVVDGGNPMNWLLEQGIQPLFRVQSTEQLLALLHKDRVNVVLTDEYAMQQALHELPELAQPATRFMRFVPLSVYFSKQFLLSHPGFLAQFEQAVEQCSIAPPALSAEQQQQVRRWARGYLTYWRSQPALLQALRTAATAPAPSADSLKQADARWLLEQDEPLQPLISQVISTPISEQLQRSVADDNLLSEVMVTDVYGQLLAASGRTSDYYQGDERSFVESQTLSGSELLIEPIEYDASTQKMAIRVSGPIRGADRDDFLGVLTLGADAEQLH